jgi:hypothetical protein
VQRLGTSSLILGNVCDETGASTRSTVTLKIRRKSENRKLRSVYTILPAQVTDTHVIIAVGNGLQEEKCLFLATQSRMSVEICNNSCITMAGSSRYILGGDVSLSTPLSYVARGNSVVSVAFGDAVKGGILKFVWQLETQCVLVSVVAETCLPSRCPERMLFSEPFASNGCFSGSSALAFSKYATILHRHEL